MASHSRTDAKKGVTSILLIDTSTQQYLHLGVSWCVEQSLGSSLVQGHSPKSALRFYLLFVLSAPCLPAAEICFSVLSV
eukprot:6310120-Amphidinium_carterae.1